MNRRFLRIYMNDQLAAGVAWREVARRARNNNEGFEPFRAEAGRQALGPSR